MLAAALVLLLGLAGKAGAILPAGENPGYVSRLFDGSRVHRVDIQVEDWEAFLASAPEEEYIPATVEIDGEAFRQVGLRAKGNNSLRLTAEYGLSRYSLKLEFDHYTDGSYHGLDKLSLDASFQDNSYLKTWLAFDIMEFLGVPTPLRSFVWVTVNGQPWGLFLAVEEPEEAFARRNFGANHGQLYKPDYRSLAEENADVHLRYTTGEPEDYPGIFENAKLDPSAADRQRLVDSLKILNSGEDLETAVDVEQVLRYFVGQVFVMNWDSYLGHTGHNYLLYEEEGKLSMLPWDYNLAFGTYALGMTDPITDPNVLLNYPILTPAPGEYMTERPLYHQLMQVDAYYLAVPRAVWLVPRGVCGERGAVRRPVAGRGVDCPLCKIRPHGLLLLRGPPPGGGDVGAGVPAPSRKRTGPAGGPLSRHLGPANPAPRGGRGRLPRGLAAFGGF